MGGFGKLMKNVVGSVGRVLGFAPTPAASKTTLYQTGGAGGSLGQAAAAREAETDRLRREELARQAEETRRKTEAEAKAADDKKRILAEEEAKRKAAVAASGRASTILAGEGAAEKFAGKSLLGS